MAVVALAIVTVVAGVTALTVTGTGPWAGSGALGPPRFVDEAASAGLLHAYTGEYPYVVGGGVATFDCDDDRRPDLYLAGGEGPAALFRNTSPVGGALRFEAVQDPTTDLTAVTGAYPIDIDGDRLTDLAVLRLGETVVLRGLGDCRFEPANERFGLPADPAWTVAFSASWETADATLPSLAFGRYLRLDADGAPASGCDDGLLVRPAADGTTYAAPLPLTPGWCSLSMLFSDWDRSGRRDLRVSNDRHYYVDGEEQLWRVAPTEAPRLYTRDEGWARLRLWGMGIASQDVTGDRYPEVYLTSQGDNKLQTLADGPGRPAYEDIALDLGVTAHRPYAGGEDLPSTAWHPDYGDVNADGYLDLYLSKGNVGGEVGYAEKDPSDLFIGQADGTFAEGAEAAGILRFGMARGAALVDLNLDGALDLVQVLRNENVRAWRNVGSGDATTPVPMGHWIAVDLEQPGANHDAIGAWLEIEVGGRTQQHEVTIGGGHASGDLGWIHAGLGTAADARVRVTWPDGEVGPWLTIGADTFATIERGATAATPWTP